MEPRNSQGGGEEKPPSSQASNTTAGCLQPFPKDKGLFTPTLDTRMVVGAKYRIASLVKHDRGFWGGEISFYHAHGKVTAFSNRHSLKLARSVYEEKDGFQGEAATTI